MWWEGSSTIAPPLAIIVVLSFSVAAGALFSRHLITLLRHLGIERGLKEYAMEGAYNRTVLALSYFRDGFVRRGLGGTITDLLSSHWATSTLLFVALSVVWLAVPMGVLAVQLSRRLGFLPLCFVLGLAALSPQTFLGWGYDPARTDMFAAGFVAWSVVATLSGYRATGVAVVLVALLVHETGLIFGAPLLLVMNWHDLRRGLLERRLAIRLGVLFVGGLAAIPILQAVFSDSQSVLAAHMLRTTPSFAYDPMHRLWRDIAIYMSATGSRALQTALCHNYSFNPQYPIMAFFCIVALAIYAIILPIRTKPLAAVVVMAAPVVFMLLIANDTGRWLRLGVLNGWLITTFYLLRGDLHHALSVRWIAAGVVTVSILLSMGYTPYNAVNATTVRWARHLGFADPAGLQEWMDTCDPGWTQRVYGRNEQASSP